MFNPGGMKGRTGKNKSVVYLVVGALFFSLIVVLLSMFYGDRSELVTAPDQKETGSVLNDIDDLPVDQTPDMQLAQLWKRKQWQGDLDGMRKRKVIRALVPFSRTYYFLDRGRKRGLTYDILKQYEKFLNRQIKKRNMGVHVVVIPTPRDRLFSDLLAGYGDIAAGNLTITVQRKQMVDFSDPLMTEVKEIVVTNSSEPKMNSIFDLSGKNISVRKSSSYYESLQLLNTTLHSVGKKPVTITIVDEYLEDEDLLEMVNVGLVPMLIIDKHKGELWAKIYKDIKLHNNLVLRSGGKIGWAIRKGSPLLQENINRFVQSNKKGTLIGNIIYHRYLEDTGYIENNLSDKAMQRYKHTIGLFKKYGVKYNFSYQLLTALAYQESGLDQNKKSSAGAIGIMQVLPRTAADPNVNVKHIDRLENNIHAGTRYLRFMEDRYFSDPALTPLNRDLLTIASYNAGPARVAKLRKEAAQMELDPNIWFNNVEVVAAERIGRETVRYVRNIYKYYVAYEYMEQKKVRRKKGSKNLELHYQRENS